MPSRGTGRTEGSRVGTGEADMALIVVGVAGAGRPGPRRGPGAGADVTWLIVISSRIPASVLPGPSLGELPAASQYPGGMFRSLGALVGDLLVVILFVAIGFVQHGTPLTTEIYTLSLHYALPI